LLILHTMASDAGSVAMSMSDMSDDSDTRPIVMPGPISPGATLTATDQQYLDLRYPTEIPLNSTIADERTLQDLSHTLSVGRIIWLENYATVKGLVAKHERAKEVQRLHDEELEQARLEYESLGYDPLSPNLTEEQEAKEKERCMDAALEVFGIDVLGPFPYRTMTKAEWEEEFGLPIEPEFPPYHTIPRTEFEIEHGLLPIDHSFDWAFLMEDAQPELKGGRNQEQALDVSDYTADASDASQRKRFKV
jgi:hypothetical protein